MAAGGFAGAAAFCGDWVGRVHAGSLDDFAHAAVDRSGHASRSIRLGAGDAGGSWAAEGQRIAIDATTLEANAAMRSIVRRDTGESYEEFLRGLAKASGIETPTREDLARLDRKRKKRTSNKEWKSPADEDARVAKMKDGRTHLAHKAEHAVDLDTGAVVAVTLQGADQGDTTTLDETLCEAGMTVAELAGREAELRPDDEPKVNVNGIEELVTDKGYHSGAVIQRVKSYEVRSYIPEKQQKGRRNWQGKPKSSRRFTRIGGEYAAVRQELTEAARRVGGTQLRALLRNRRHAALPSARTGQHFEAAVGSCGRVQPEPVMRKLLGAGTPRELRNRLVSLF